MVVSKYTQWKNVAAALNLNDSPFIHLVALSYVSTLTFSVYFWVMSLIWIYFYTFPPSVHFVVLSLTFFLVYSASLRCLKM